MAEKIKKYGFKQGLPQEFEIVDVTQLYNAFETDLTRPHRTAFFHIIWFQKGPAKHLVDFNPVDVAENIIIFLSPNVVQCFDRKANVKAKAILFTEDFFSQTTADTKHLRSSILFNDLLTVPAVYLEDKADLFETLFSLMETEYNKVNDPFQALILRNYLRTFMLEAERLRRKQNFTEVKKGPNLDFVIQFKNLLENHFKSEKTVSYYAKALNITEKRLNQAVSKILGLSPKQLIDERIMLEAKRLLAHTNESVKEIAFELGFEEPTNFVKYFKKHYPSTPVQFRVAVQ
mgnify:CR=1 FL=1